MTAVTPNLLPVVLVLVVLVAGIFFWQAEKKRRVRLAEWARRQGWQLREGKRRELNHDFPAIKLFGKGHSRFGQNEITGKFRGMPVSCLDYQYTTGSGKNRSTHRFGVALLLVDHPLIPLQIRPEHAFDKVGEFLGMDDIDFESAEFSRRFYVKSPDRKWAFDVIHARTMEYLLAAPGGYSIEFGLGEIAVYRGGRCEPDQYEKAVKLARELYDLIPGYVREQMKGK